MALSIAPSTGPSPKTSASPPPPLSSSDPSSSSAAAAAVRSPSPQPPPASPLTPPAQPAKLAAHAQPVPAQSTPAPSAQFIDQPPPLPFSSHESSDAIALRAAISSLQFQRLQAQRDLRTLQDIKRQAVEHPEAYRQHVIATSQSKSTSQAKPTPPPWAIGDSSDQDTEDEDDAVLGAPDMHGQDRAVSQSEDSSKHHPVSYGSMLHPQERKAPRQPSSFPAVPLPQHVVRCPPIEWAKYNIVGESLDKLHRDQQARPGHVDSSQRDSVVAAPYNPFLDKLDPRPSSETPSMRKDSGSSASDPHAHRRLSKAAM